MDEKTDATEKANDGTKLKELDIGQKVFSANGKEYFIEPHVSAERFREMQLIEIQLGFEIDYKKMSQRLAELYQLLNEQNFADAAVLCYNLQNGIADIENREMPILRYCAMFINTEKEDRRKVDEKVIDEKINDWNQEGISYHSFFLTAISMVNGLKENYEKHIQDTSRKSNS